MDFTEYRKRGKEMVDYIADYLENIRDRRVFPDVKPGYMKNLLPDSAPIEGEQWDMIFSDVERVIMPGITHWQSPHMHAYFPALNSFPSLLGDMLADAINCLGFTWASSPACTELEIIVMNWLGKMINLPDDFLHLSSSSRGGGVIQTTASEATLVCLLAGRTRAIQRFHEKRPGFQDAEINARLVAYCSDQAHSSVEKAALIGLVRMRYIEADENLSMRGQLLRDAIEDDIRQGLVPFWVCATLGTTGSCSFDNLEEVGIVCREFNLWLHVDAAYAGSAFICPEFRTWLKGIEHADSIAFNPSKWLMVHFDATALWVKDSTAVHRTFNVEPLYLQHENSGVAVDFMHWQIPLSRRFRALKIWFVLRSFGIKGLQRHIREGVRLAQKFEALISADHRFEIPAKRHLGLVVFRIKGDNEITERLLKRLNHRGNLHCIPSSLKGKYVIRFTVTSTYTTVDDILSDWMEIKNSATAILDEMHIKISNRVYLKDTKEKCDGFGSSLLLSNSPLSPKIVNGSFAALFDADEFLAKTYAGIRIAHQESPSMRRRVRGILMSGKQFSLDSHMDVVVQSSMNSQTTNSKMIDCYGKTTTNVKSDEHDTIREDEESLEDCEMCWILNNLQCSPINCLTILNNQKLVPIDIIHHRNNHSILNKYCTKFEVKNFTKSVNSVRTPLTQYQLYNCPRQHIRFGNKTEKQIDSSELYPGKRYLNLDLSFKKDSIFTDTIFNLPTPTEDVIPIIITADTPTASVSSTEEEEEDFHKLRPPSSNLISIQEETQDSTKICLSPSKINNVPMKSKDSKKPPPPDINSIPRPQISKIFQNRKEFLDLTFNPILNKSSSEEKNLAKQKPLSPAEDLFESITKINLKSSVLIEEEGEEEDDLLRREVKGSNDSPIDSTQKEALKEKNNEGNNPATFSTEAECFSVLHIKNNESVEDPSQTFVLNENYSVAHIIQDQSEPNASNKDGNTSGSKEVHTEKSTSNDISCSPSSETESDFSSPKTSFFVENISVINNLKSSIQSQKSSNEVDDSSVLQKINSKTQNAFTKKSKDDSSSSDEFLESIRQPLNNSEDSSTGTSSLELM